MTTRRIRTSDILGKSYYTYELSSSNYTPNQYSTITVTCKCTDVYGNNVENKILTLYQNDISKGQSTTNSNGIATWNINCSNAGIQKISVENSNIEIFINESDVPLILFEDDCSTNQTSQYSDIVRLQSSNTTPSLTFDSSTNTYSYVGSGGDYFCGKVIPIAFQDNIVISVDVKMNGTSAYNQLMIGLTDSLYQTNNGTYDIFRIRGDNRSDYIHNNVNSETWSQSNIPIVNNWVTMEFSIQNSIGIGKIYNSNKDIIAQTTQPLNTYTNPYIFLGINCNTSQTKNIKNIKIQTTDSQKKDIEIVTSWNNTTSDEKVPSEKLVKNSLDNKSDIGHVHTKSQITDFPTIPSKTSDLTNDSGFLTSHQSLDSKTVTVQKLATAETGYLSSYIVKQNGVQVGNAINIPKDFLVKSGSVKTVSTANNPVSGYKVGDKYIDLVINVQEGTATDSHIYILVSDLIDTPVAISDVTGLQSALNDKANSNHTHYNIQTTFGDTVFDEGRDYNGEGISYGSDKLIYNSDETRFYYDKNGAYDADPGNELVVMNDLNSTEKISNKVTSISSSSTDTQYPSAKCVYDENDYIWNYVEGLDYTNIGGSLVDVDKGIQAIGLEQILTQIIAKINSNQHTHDDRYFTETEVNNKLSWKTLSLTNMAGFTLYYNDYFCHLVMNRSGTLPTAGAYTNLVSGTIPSGYRPKIATTIFADGTSTIRVKVNDSGTVQYYTEKAFTSSATIRGTFTWAR